MTRASRRRCPQPRRPLVRRSKAQELPRHREHRVSTPPLSAGVQPTKRLLCILRTLSAALRNQFLGGGYRSERHRPALLLNLLQAVSMRVHPKLAVAQPSRDHIPLLQPERLAEIGRKKHTPLRSEQQSVAHGSVRQGLGAG